MQQNSIITCMTDSMHVFQTWPYGFLPDMPVVTAADRTGQLDDTSQHSLKGHALCATTFCSAHT